MNTYLRAISPILGQWTAIVGFFTGIENNNYGLWIGSLCFWLVCSMFAYCRIAHAITLRWAQRKSSRAYWKERTEIQPIAAILTFFSLVPTMFFIDPKVWKLWITEKIIPMKF